MEIKTPLRYPGGKTRAIKFLKNYIPCAKEYREPFIGGGSVFVNSFNEDKFDKYWINDLNSYVSSFWISALFNNNALVKKINSLYSKKGEKLFKELKSTNFKNELEEGAAFFAINRMSFSGTADSGGFSKLACENRFTISSIERVSLLDKICNTYVSAGDYSDLLKEEGEGVFIFLDPPYYLAEKSKLYGKNGNLHEGFDHIRLKKELDKCKHHWIMTYDNSNYIKKLYKDYFIKEFSLSYSMSKNKKKINNEILISNERL